MRRQELAARAEPLLVRGRRRRWGLNVVVVLDGDIVVRRFVLQLCFFVVQLVVVVLIQLFFVVVQLVVLVVRQLGLRAGRDRALL